jgi:hypothetical protein
MLVVGLVLSAVIYWWTICRQKQDWSLGAIRVVCFMGMIVSYFSGSVLWFWACIAIFILALFTDKAKGGETVDSDSSSQ